MAKAFPQPSEKNSTENSVTFSSFETSATIIERTKWRIESPIAWKALAEDDAKKFIKNPPQRDKRKNLGKNRFRLLLVRCPGINQIYKQQALLQTAAEYGWVGERFMFFIKNHTGGSAVLDSTESISFIAQTPNDDNYPSFSFSLSDKYLEGRQRDTDWVCLFFLGHNFTSDLIQSLLCRDPVPNDYSAPLSPDFMFLPVALLRWQVEQITNELTNIKRDIMNQDEELISKHAHEEFKEIRTNLFKMRKKHLMLHRRWLFAQELAGNLMRCFERIEKRNGSGEPAEYSATLRDSVQAQEGILGTLLHDLDTTPLRMEAQQAMIDNLTSMMIAKNSEIAAQEARRDSSSMKTIAVVTLIFLPGTFVAAVFSMSIFNWQAGGENGDSVTSNYIWLYFVIATSLTLVVLLVWTLWCRWTDKKYQTKWADKIV